MMMKAKLFKRRVMTIIACVMLVVCMTPVCSAQGESPLPHLRKRGTSTQLIVDGKPFLILGGELGNSTSSSLEYMRALWPRFVSLNWPDYARVVYHARDYNIEASKIMLTGGSIQLSGSNAQPTDQPSPR